MFYSKGCLHAVLVLCLSSTSAWADSALSNFLAHSEQVKNLQAKFVQTTRDSRGGKLQELSGDIALVKPNKMRWHTAPPFEQLVVADGVDLWVYDKDLEQVTIRTLEQRIADMPALLLSGDSEAITKDFSVSEKRSGDITRFTLVPKDKSQLFETIEFQYGAGALESMRIVDASGQATSILFSQVRMNQTIPAQHFKFTPPEGVDVIDARHAH